MIKKELDELYQMALGYHIGKGGVEKGIGLAMDCYQDFLNKATPKYPNYLNAYHGMAKLYKEMATWAAITTWQMRLRIGKTAPSSTTRQLSSSITRGWNSTAVCLPSMSMTSYARRWRTAARREASLRHKIAHNTTKLV